MTRWTMVIDLKKCAGCQTCSVACKVENFVPPNVFWNRVYDYEVGEYPNVRRSFLPAPCMHCQKAPCVEACPTGATIQRGDGIVYVDYTKCIGCRYCVVVCPYQARTFNEKVDAYFGVSFTPYEEFPYDLRTPQQQHLAGSVSKCTFCVHKIDEGLGKGLKPGTDRDATPACVIGCIAEARYFGDLDDPDSEVSKLVRRRGGLQLLKELGTDPSVFYLH